MPETTLTRGQCTISFAFEIIWFRAKTVFELGEGVHVFPRTVQYHLAPILT